MSADLLMADFRGYNAAAPLKRNVRVFTSPYMEEFPRLQRRGPIEAVSGYGTVLAAGDFRGYNAAAPLKPSGADAAPCDSPDFRGYNAAAPLKHPGITVHLDRPLPFPRLQRRGPIEARCSASAARGSAPDFRGYNAAAPLKQLEYGEFIDPMRYFRGYNAAAPLKP